MPPHNEFDSSVSPQRALKTMRSHLMSLTLLAVASIFFGCVICYLTAKQLNQPPSTFPVNQPVIVEPGMSMRAIAQHLEESGVVRSETFLYYVLITLYDPTTIKASTYIFENPLTTIEIAERLTQGDFNSDLIRFTHREGESVALLSRYAAEALPNVDATEFRTLATAYEGKLFPETYLVPKSFSGEDLLELLLTTYAEETAALRPAIEAHTLTEDEIIILASILEREANSPESMRLVSGILQNRLAINMPLQADATIEYALETPLGELPPGQLAAELRELDSPYNSYLNTGLPPTAIGNPGLEAITAVLGPIESDYFYYITGDDGEFYYAKTYDEHLNNIARYLR